MGGEGVLSHEVEHGTESEDVELRAVHLVHLDPPQCHSNHLRIAEVLRPVGRQRHCRPQGRDQPEIDQMRPPVVDDDVVRLDVLVPQPAVVVPQQRPQQILEVAKDNTQALAAEALVARFPVALAGDDAQVLALVVGHDVEERVVVHPVIEHQPQLFGGFQSP